MAGCWVSGSKMSKTSQTYFLSKLYTYSNFATYISTPSMTDLHQFISSHIFTIKQLLESARRLPLMVPPMSKLAKLSNSTTCLQLRCLYGSVSKSWGQIRGGGLGVLPNLMTHTLRRFKVFHNRCSYKASLRKIHRKFSMPLQGAFAGAEEGPGPGLMITFVDSTT